MLRRGAAGQVVSLFRDHYNIRLVHADASEQFLKALAGVTDPASAWREDVEPRRRGRAGIDRHVRAKDRAEWAVQRSRYITLESISPVMFSSPYVLATKATVAALREAGGNALPNVG